MPYGNKRGEVILKSNHNQTSFQFRLLFKYICTSTSIHIIAMFSNKTWSNLICVLQSCRGQCPGRGRARRRRRTSCSCWCSHCRCRPRTWRASTASTCSRPTYAYPIRLCCTRTYECPRYIDNISIVRPTRSTSLCFGVCAMSQSQSQRHAALNEL